MEKFTYTIREENGIHARPAGLFVSKVKEKSDKVTIDFNGKAADGKRLISVMGLGVKQNDTVTVTVEGENEKDTARELLEFMQNNL